MKKVITLITFLLSSCLIFLSCSKSSTTTPTTTNIVLGYWFGSFRTSTNLTGNEGELFKSDGSTVQYDFYGQSSTDTATCLYKAYGTYTLNKDTLNTVLNYPTLSESFTETTIINTSVIPNTMAGSFTGSQAGTFSLTKQ